MSISLRTKLNIRSLFKQTLPDQPCVLCGRMNQDGLWCAACDADMPYYTQPHCPTCALPSPLGEVCGQCLKQVPAFQHTFALFSYSFPVNKLIQAMKYGEQLALGRYFALQFAQHIAITERPDYLIPMPIHPAKLRARGFNQSQLLAQHLSRALDIPLLSQACQRTRDTPAQSTLAWHEREKNVRNAFVCETDLSNKHIALIDDVLTTGATLNALALAVQQQGARQISTWVIARTLPHQQLLSNNFIGNTE